MPSASKRPTRFIVSYRRSPRARSASGAIGDIDLALQVRPDVSHQITSVYEEARVALPQVVIKRLEDVQTFNRKLYENRKKRLTIEREVFEARLS